MSVELIIATFDDNEEQAGRVLDSIHKLAKDGALTLENAAVIVKDKEGEIKVQDPGDVDSKRGRVFGAITGGIVGLLGGPVGAIVGAAAGAATGGVTAKLADYGVPDKMIKDIGHGLKPGSSALIAYVTLTWVERAISLLEQNGATVSHTTLQTGDLSDRV